MLDIRFVRENVDLVRRKMLERGQDVDLDLFVSLDGRRRDILQNVESLRSDRNRVSKEIGKRKQNKEDAADLISQMGQVSARIKELEEIQAALKERVLAMQAKAPPPAAAAIAVAAATAPATTAARVATTSGVGVRRPASSRLT